MIELTDAERRRAFSAWLRTGRLSTVRSAEGVELKFNPWHDPDDGRFTFAGNGRYYGLTGEGDGSGNRPGGKIASRSDRPGGSSASLERFARASSGNAVAQSGGQAGARTISVADATTSERLRQVGDIASSPVANQARPPARPGPTVGRGSNSRAFEDPMTLEQSFPGLRNAPGGAVVAVAYNLFDLTGPADVMTASVLQDQAKRLTVDIKALNPAWHYDEIVPTDALGNPIRTVQSLTAKVNDLRFQRAATIARVTGDYAPLRLRRSASFSSAQTTPMNAGRHCSKPAV